MSKLREPVSRYIYGVDGGFNVSTPDRSSRFVATYDKAVKLRNKLWGHPALRYVSRKKRKGSIDLPIGLSLTWNTKTRKGVKYRLQCVQAMVITQQGKTKQKAAYTKRRGLKAAIAICKAWRDEELKKMGIRRV